MLSLMLFFPDQIYNNFCTIFRQLTLSDHKIKGRDFQLLLVNKMWFPWVIILWLLLEYYYWKISQKRELWQRSIKCVYFQMRIFFKANKILHTSFLAMFLKSGLFPGILFGFLAEQMNNCEKRHIYVHIHSMHAFLPIIRGDDAWRRSCCLPKAAQATMSRRKNVPPFGAMVKTPARLSDDRNQSVH